MIVGDIKNSNFSLSYEGANVPYSIRSISPTSASPVNKGRMKILGKNLGTDKKKITVYLIDTVGEAK